MDRKVTLEMIQEAREALQGVTELTPIVSSTRLGKNLYIKSENLQKTGSFKIRGAFNKIRKLSPEEAAKGVIACSAGNHAQGVALSATRLGIKSVICMPEGAPLLKVEATRGYGAEVVLVPGVYDDAAAEAARLSETEGYTFAHPFNDPYVIAGQGTIGLEILDQVPDVEQVVVPIGGGGLISGVAVAIKSMRPNVKVIGVQSSAVPSMFISHRVGMVSTVKDAPTIADGIHVLTPGDLTFSLVEQFVDEIVTVSEDEIAAAIVGLLEGPKTVAEGAGATSVAAYLFDKIDTNRSTRSTRISRPWPSSPAATWTLRRSAASSPRACRRPAALRRSRRSCRTAPAISRSCSPASPKTARMCWTLTTSARTPRPRSAPAS